MLKCLKRSQWFWWYDLKHQAMRKPLSHKKKRISRSAFAGSNYCATWSHGGRHHKSPDTWNISTPITRNFLFAGTIEQRKKVEQRKESETDCQNPSNQMNNAKILSQYYFFSLTVASCKIEVFDYEINRRLCNHFMIYALRVQLNNTTACRSNSHLCYFFFR